MDITQVNQAVMQLESAFAAIQQPRSDFALRNFVVGEKDTEPARYAQCVLELQMKHGAIKRGLLHRKKLTIEAARLRERGDEIADIEADIKDLDIADIDLATSGALREFECLYGIWRSFPRQYTHEELQTDQSDYWLRRLARQAEQDKAATGRVGAGNMEALRQAGIQYAENESGESVYSLSPAVPGGAGAHALSPANVGRG